MLTLEVQLANEIDQAMRSLGRYFVTEKLRLSVDVAMDPPIHATVSLDQSMALFLIAFSAILLVGFGFAAVLMIVRTIRRR